MIISIELRFTLICLAIVTLLLLCFLVLFLLYCEFSCEYDCNKFLEKAVAKITCRVSCETLNPVFAHDSLTLSKPAPNRPI